MDISNFDGATKSVASGLERFFENTAGIRELFGVVSVS
ncbi:hypothetical protein COO91_09222 (plasmid) [Nostoc flagelliforme CCNUN1]|uniref:Uncharacterized protein n=1 Tax=Nostoc flagelliforme CCNUN1 TaxID=2038116 RepID=A0A2K8T5T9_9NOSO|nr:hypothetical protein COO91_09222 [Nostoc flagelliforme CCNUN1]